MDRASNYARNNTIHAIPYTLNLNQARYLTVWADLGTKFSGDWKGFVKPIFAISEYYVAWSFNIIQVLLGWAFSILNPWTYLTQTSRRPTANLATLKFQLGSTEGFTLTVPEWFYLETTGFMKGAVVLAVIFAFQSWVWPVIARWWWPPKPKKPRAPRKPKQTPALLQTQQKLSTITGQQTGQTAK